MPMRGDPRPSGQHWRRQTLETMIRRRKDLRVSCKTCGHQATHSPIWFVMWHDTPKDITLYELVQRLRCGKCKSTAVGIEIEN